MYFKIEGEKITFKILAKPNAKRSQLLKVTEDALHIALHAKPQEGEANQELINFLAEFFQVPKSQITLKLGARSKHKIVMLPLNARIKEFCDLKDKG